MRISVKTCTLVREDQKQGLSINQPTFPGKKAAPTLPDISDVIDIIHLVLLV